MFDPKDFLIIAEELLNGDTDAHYRSSINRAYYATHGLLKTKLNIKDNTPNSHNTVIETLTAGDKKKFIAGKKLQAMFELRKTCDYNYNAPALVKSRPEFQIKEAKEILRLIKESDLEK